MGEPGRPYSELAANELADWLDRQGQESWWIVDGDPILMGRLPFPCPSTDLAQALREIGRPLLVVDLNGGGEEAGGPIDSNDLERFVFFDPLLEERAFQFRWKEAARGDDWMLFEDKESARLALDA